MTVRHAGHQQAQAEPLRAPGHEAERRVALEHRVGRRRHPVHLEEVVHERQRADADGLGAAGEIGDAGTDAGRRAGPVEAGAVEVEFHALRSAPAAARAPGGTRRALVVSARRRAPPPCRPLAAPRSGAPSAGVGLRREIRVVQGDRGSGVAEAAPGRRGGGEALGPDAEVVDHVAHVPAGGPGPGRGGVRAVEPGERPGAAVGGEPSTSARASVVGIDHARTRHSRHGSPYWRAPCRSSADQSGRPSGASADSLPGGPDVDHWIRWHTPYDDPGSSLSRRLAVVQRRLRDALDGAPPGPVRLISLCSGQGRDVIEVLADHPRRTDVTARLVEAGARLVADARDLAEQAGVDGIELVCGLVRRARLRRGRLRHRARRHVRRGDPAPPGRPLAWRPDRRFFTFVGDGADAQN